MLKEHFGALQRSLPRFRILLSRLGESVARCVDPTNHFLALADSLQFVLQDLAALFPQNIILIAGKGIKGRYMPHRRR